GAPPGGVGGGPLGAPFGGGPPACALVEAVIGAIEEGGLLARVRELSRLLRATCLAGPVVAIQGEGFLLGLRTARPAREIQAELLERGILTGLAGDPHIVRLLPPLVLEAAHVHTLASALGDIGPAASSGRP